MPRIRIGIDFHIWDGKFQGSRSYVLGLYKAAIRMAPDIDFVFFLRDTESLKAAHPEFGLAHVELVSVRKTSAWKRYAYQLTWLRIRHRLDVMHTQYRVPFLSADRTLCTIHDILFESHPEHFHRLFVMHSRLSIRHAAKAAGAVLTVSEFSRSEIMGRYGVDGRRIGVTRNGVDLVRFCPGDADAGTLSRYDLTPGGYILSVGRLEPRKNYARLIRAWGCLGEDAPDLVLVGQKDFMFTAIFDALRDAPRRERIHILERVDDKDLVHLMRGALIFAFPTLAEGFGMPVLEAMACGTPVLTSDVTALPEVTGDAAVLVDPTCVDAITQGLAGMLNDPDHLRLLASRGLERAGQWTWIGAAQVLIERARALAHERRSSR